jgi:predicted ABC-type ATPase
MSAVQPRLRMFAGPNGSGKSTLKDELDAAWLGVYVNADDIEADIRAHGFASLAPYGITTTQEALQAFFADSAFLRQQGLGTEAQKIRLVEGRVVFDGVAVNSYFASVLVDFIRQDLLRRKESFTFETVMSARAKVDFFCRAREQGFRTYLYYVATEDPEINISRVAHRVAMGKHDVPRDKIIERYHRSLSLLADAVTCADRAYVFDNSDSDRVWVAEVTDGVELELKTDLVPYWVKTALLDKLVDDDAGTG